MEYTTEFDGYTARDTISGIDVSDSNGSYVCELSGVHLSDFMDEDENIDEEKLEQAINEEMDIEATIADQHEYC